MQYSNHVKDKTMKYSILLAVLLGASSLFGAQQIQPVDEQANIQLKKAKEELAQEKANREAEAIEIAVIAQAQAQAAAEAEEQAQKILEENSTMRISVVGQGVAPMNTASPAQAYALAKRAAIADAYRAIAEKVKGVRIDGQDLIKNMMVKRSTIRTSVKAMVRNANVVETTFKDGLCEVEMEIVLSHSDFAQ
jgi:hypothetical protein